MTNNPTQTTEERLREKLIDAIDDRRFDKDFPALNHKDIEWLVDNCLLPSVKAELGAALIAELTSCLSQVPMPSLSYDQLQNRIAELRNHFGIGEASDD